MKDGITWDCVVQNITARNRGCADSKHKLLFLQRHGEGFHNVAESIYDKQDWKCHWQRLKGNGEIEWYDAELTHQGKKQAREISDAWDREVFLRNAPIPQSFYSSPLRRCLETHEAIWGRQSGPIVKENARETYGIGTESKRHPKSYLKKKFPHVSFEHRFSEKDELWNTTHHESKEHRNYRATLLLNDIFSHDDNDVISITSHSGLITSILNVVGHREWTLGTGQMIPIVVEASLFEEYDPPELTKPWKTLHCEK